MRHFLFLLLVTLSTYRHSSADTLPSILTNPLRSYPHTKPDGAALTAGDANTTTAPTRTPIAAPTLAPAAAHNATATTSPTPSPIAPPTLAPAGKATTAAPAPAPPSEKDGSARARTAIGILMTIVIVMIAAWGAWVFFAEIGAGLRMCISRCRTRSADDNESGALNNIIFDPENDEGTNNDLSRSLLTDIA